MFGQPHQTLDDWNKELTQVSKKKNSTYRIYWNKRRGAYLIFRTTSAVLIRGWCLFEGGAYLKIVPDKLTFSIYLFNGTLSIS